MRIAEWPTDKKERSDLLFSGIEGKDIEKFPQYYADYATHATTLVERAHPLDLVRHPPDAHETVGAWLAEHAPARADAGWAPWGAGAGMEGRVWSRWRWASTSTCAGGGRGAAVLQSVGTEVKMVRRGCEAASPRGRAGPAIIIPMAEGRATLRISSIETAMAIW